ncbi:MAG: RecT family recombinase [Candidatus Puniceispirillaceae bacterium]
MSEENKSLVASLADKYEMKREAFLDTVKKTVMPSANVSNEHLAAFLMVAKEVDLNPLTDQIHAFPHKGGVKAMIGVDGFIAIANRHPAFDGMEVNLNRDGEGQVISATCKIHRKDRSHPTIIEEDLEECKRNTEPWKQFPKRMLRHKAIMQGVRVAFGGSNLIDEDEARDMGYDPDKRQMKDITEEAEQKESDLQKRLESAAETQTDEEVEVIEKVAETKDGPVSIEVDAKTPYELAQDKIRSYTRKRDLESYLKVSKSMKWPQIGFTAKQIKDLEKLGQEQLEAIDQEKDEAGGSS